MFRLNSVAGEVDESFFVRLQAPNGKIIAVGEDYTRLERRFFGSYYTNWRKLKHKLQLTNLTVLFLAIIIGSAPYQFVLNNDLVLIVSTAVGFISLLNVIIVFSHS